MEKLQLPVLSFGVNINIKLFGDLTDDEPEAFAQAIAAIEMGDAEPGKVDHIRRKNCG